MSDNESYHSDTSAISKSGTDLIEKCPAKYYQKYLAPPLIVKKEPSKALLFGHAFHTFILEPEVFKRDFVIEPKFSGKGSTYEKDKFRANNGGKTIISMEDYVTIQGMEESIKNHKIANILLSENGINEQRFDWIDINTGVKCKIKPDRYNYKRDLVLDLKSTEDASPDGFKFSAKKFRYFVQSPFYMDGLRANGFDPKGFIFIVVEKEPPYLVALYMYDDDINDFGRETYIKNLETYKNCLETGDWYGYSDQIEELELPGIY